MEDIDEQLKRNIRSILNSIPEETINGIINAVKYAGLESLSDLQFVQEEDLVLVLKPIQRRKLIKAWSEQNFPAVELPSHVPLKKCKWNKQNRLVLLQVYRKYKEESSCPDKEKHEVWRKIADEVAQTCSLNCNELQCMDKIKQLKLQYEKLKKNVVISDKKAVFFYVAQNAFENVENSVISPADSSNSFPIQKCKWNKKRPLKLLQVYTKYKVEFSHPNVEELTVWKKIADELQVSYFLTCNEFDCRNKIDELRCQYEKKKNESVTNEKTAIFLDEARKAFEITEVPVNISDAQSNNTPLLSLKKERKSGFRLRLLEVYANYKNELSCSDIEEEKVWEEIAKEIRERYSYNCGASLCRFELLLLKSQYENSKGAHSKNMRDLIDVARKAFETSENLATFNSQSNETKKVGKYIPPHLRNGGNKRELTMTSEMKGVNTTVRVTNLSENVKDSDLQELFRPFGTIARIYLPKDKSTGLAKGFAFIRYHKQEDAARTIQVLNGCTYDNLILSVEWAKSSKETEIAHFHIPMESFEAVREVPTLPLCHDVKPRNFNMSEFKKVYSNEEKSVCIKYFWDNFDAENYSIWFCEYLYPDEQASTFLSNLIEEMFQRLYMMRENAFASVCLFDEDNSCTISGIWVWRGHELLFTLSPDWQVDYESYSWKKLDPSSEKTKKLVNEYFAWSGEFGGKKFNQGKIFK